MCQELHPGRQTGGEEPGVDLQVPEAMEEEEMKKRATGGKLRLGEVR